MFRSDLLDDVRDVYEKRQLEFIEASRVQAEFPEGATPMRNPRGTAPGIWVEREGRIFAAMPGVPYEMQGMMRDFILPRLKKVKRSSFLKFRTLHTIGIKEAQLFQELENLEEIQQHAKLAFLPSYSGVRMRLTVNAKNEETAEDLLEKAETAVRKQVGRFIFGTGAEFTISEGVGGILTEKRIKLVVAESCTGGLLAKKLTDVPGSSGWFERGFITYSNEAKHELLGVPWDLIDKFGAVSPEVAEAMAVGALRSSRAQAALSITGVAGPSGGTEDKPVGLVYIGYADRETTTHKRHLFDADRHVNRERSVTAALTLLLDHISTKYENGDPHLL